MSATCQTLIVPEFVCEHTLPKAGQGVKWPKAVSARGGARHLLDKMPMRRLLLRILALLDIKKALLSYAFVHQKVRLPESATEAFS